MFRFIIDGTQCQAKMRETFVTRQDSKGDQDFRFLIRAWLESVGSDGFSRPRRLKSLLRPTDFGQTLLIMGRDFDLPGEPTLPFSGD
jgi:hypothetical protein